MNLNFKVTAEFKREFRMYAAAHHLSLVQVLYQAFEALRVRHDAATGNWRTGDGDRSVQPTRHGASCRAAVEGKIS